MAKKNTNKEAQAADNQKKDAAKSKKNAKAAKAPKKSEKKAAKKKKGKDGKAAKPSIPQRIKDYFRAVRSEMKRVVWPTKSELLNASVIVIGALIFFGVFIAIIDNIIIIPLDALASIGK